MKIHVDKADADVRFSALVNSYVTLRADEVFIYDEGVTNA